MGLEIRPASFRATETMSKPKKTVIEVQGTAIAVLSYKDEDFI